MWRDRGHLSDLFIRLSAGTALLAVCAWIVLAILAPEVLTAPHPGRSAALLDFVFLGQRDHPVGDQLAPLSQATRAVVLSMLVTAATLCVLAGAATRPLQRRPAWLLLTFVAAAVLAPLVVHLPIGIFDEGFIASGAMMIRDGALPIRDFYVIYGPGEYYLTAGMFALFGENYLASRALHVMLMALLGLVVAACTAALVPRSRAWLLLTTAAFLFASGAVGLNPGYPAVPATLLLMCSSLAFAEWHHTAARSKLLTASMLIGVAGAFRWDFGVFGLLSLGLATGALSLARRAAPGVTGQVLGTATAPGLALLLLAFLPFLLVGDATRWFDEVPKFLLLEFKTWRNLDFIGPTLRSIPGMWFARDRIGVSVAVARLAYASVVPCAAVMAVLVAGGRVWRKRGTVDRADALALSLGLMALFLMNQMRVRSGFPQGFPALVTSLPLIGYALMVLPAKTSVQRGGLTVLAVAMAASLIGAPLHVTQRSLREALSGRYGSGFDLPRATAAQSQRSPNGQRNGDEYADLIRHVKSVTPPGEPMLSAVSDMSRLFINDAGLYFLADRPSATRWIEMEPGLTNTEQGQRELIGGLESRRVRIVVLLTMTSQEPNATSRSNGIHLFDDYIRRTFEFSRRFGLYEVWVRRGT